MNNIKQLLKNAKNPNILRIDFDQVENKKYYQYRFRINKDINLDFKYYIDSEYISQIFINNNEYLAFYKVEIIDDILNNLNLLINTDKYLIK
jgi:hypothetical protein